MVTTKSSKRLTPFLQKGLTRQLNQREVEREADKLWLPLFLISNGIPESMVGPATKDQLAVLEEIVVRKKTSEKDVSDANTIAHALRLAFPNGLI